MKIKTLILTLILIACAIIAPAAADDTVIVPTTDTTPALPENSTSPLPVPTTEELKPTLYDHSADIAGILQTAKCSTQKLADITSVIGFDDRLKNFIEADRNETTGEPEPKTDIITNVMTFFGVQPPAYTKAEGEAAWTEYLGNFIVNYKPTGAFGGPIA